MVFKSSMFDSNNKSMVPSQRFFLYLKVKEIKAVNQALENALKLPLKKQREWASDYGVIIDHALNAFVDDSNNILEKISLDDETLELSEKLVVGLKTAMESVDTILGSEKGLES